VDSSLIAAMAQRQLGRDTPLRTFSVAMPEIGYDESPHAAEVARHIGSDHRTLEADGDVMADLRRLVAIAGEPLGDSSLLPTYWLSRAAREHVTVALSGDGGDELFGGYDRYRAMRLLHRWRQPLGMLPTFGHQYGRAKSPLTRAARLISAARRKGQSAQYLDMIRLFTPRQLGALHAPTATTIDRPPGWVEEADAAEAARRWDMGHYLPFDLLRKVDRAAMAVALEVRCPMLDTQVYDLAGHLPLAVLTPGGRPKGLLRQVAEKHLPPSIVGRKKMGFAVPIGRWFRGALHEPLRQRLLDAPHMTDLGFDRDALASLIEAHRSERADHSQRLFALLALSMWLAWVEETTT
jgi:asparagine synthase (glutamine-hydrolysing)